MFVFSKRILKWFEGVNEFRFVFIRAPSGYGKSVYAIKVALEVLKELNWDNVNEFFEKGLDWKNDRDLQLKFYQFLQKWLVYLPSEFVRKVRSIKRRIPLIIWEEIDYWLNTDNWRDPFVQKTQKYLKVSRYDFACLIGTGIDDKAMIKRMRTMDKLIGDVLKRDDEYRRMVKVFRVKTRPWGSLDFKIRWIDHYSCYAPWYPVYYWFNKPYRELAKRELEIGLEQSKYRNIVFDREKALEEFRKRVIERKPSFYV